MLSELLVGFFLQYDSFLENSSFRCSQFFKGNIPK